MRSRWLSAALVASALALGVLALGWMLAAGPSQAQSGSMHNCPPAGKWSIAVWEGDSGVAADAALATCGAGTVAAAYSLDAQTGAWSRWFSGKPDVSNLSPLSDLQGVLALGAAGGSVATQTPTATSTPAGPPMPGTGDVTLVSTNAFTTTSSILIDGESRRMHVVGEIRNDSSTPRSAGEITITIYDASDNVIGTRWNYAFDDIIMPGRTTGFSLEYPSLIYTSGETNDFPEGWTRYEVTLSPRDPYEWEEMPVDITVENVQVSTDGLHVTGNAVNSSSKTVGVYDVKAYVIYRRADGSILNAKQASALNANPLAPGGSVPFDIMFSSGEQVDFSTYIVQAYAEPE
jgi:hypothetical protein